MMSWAEHLMIYYASIERTKKGHTLDWDLGNASLMVKSVPGPNKRQYKAKVPFSADYT